MRGAIPPLPQYVFVVWCLVKHRDNFTFTFTLVTHRDIFTFTYCLLYEERVCVCVCRFYIICRGLRCSGCLQFREMVNNNNDINVKIRMASIFVLMSVFHSPCD
jgi:hypothetical protein